MNNMQHEQLFTDLAPEQAEIITAAAQGSFADASYGHANSTFDGNRNGSFTVSNLEVFDDARDGKPVYAKFQGLATDGSILTTPTKRYDRKGEKGNGTKYTGLKGSFGKNISALRVAIYREDPGRDAVAFGGWSQL